MESWRTDLAGLVGRARAAVGDEAVRVVLEELLDGLGAASVEPLPLRPSMAVLGVEACAAGWVGVLVRPSGQTSLHVAASITALVEQVREQEELGAVGVSAGGPELGSGITVTEVPRDADFAERGRAWLAAAGMAVPAMYSGMGFIEADLLSACYSACVVAQRWS